MKIAIEIADSDLLRILNNLNPGQKPAEEPATELTLEDVRSRATEVVKTDPAKFKKALLSFGVKSVPELKSEDYDRFMETLA